MTSISQLLRTLLLEGKASTQSEIKKELERQGVSISQPQISRLLHQIGAVKLDDTKGKTQYRLPHETGLIHELSSPQEKAVIRHWVINIDNNDTLIVIHTTPGAAGMVARIIDQHRLALNVLGTIAGDDTIFVTPQHIQNILDTKSLIESLIQW